MLLVTNALAHLFSAAASSAPPVRDTECGKVSGAADPFAPVDVFTGIRYAAVEKRWTPPVPLSEVGRCWAPCLLPATKKLPGCVDLGGTGVEDCLTLNVWQPRSRAPPRGRPVMVYFHGGDLTGGSAGTAFGKLASHSTGAVIVDVNYRLAAGGFLSLTQMMHESADKQSSGGFGFLDMLESLRWVQRNIKGFSGDPSRVTIFGQSSGGTAVLALLASPLSTGLFSGGMSLSGSPNISMSIDVQRQQHAAITRAMHCEGPDAAAVMTCMRAGNLSSGGALQHAVPQDGDHANGTLSSPSWAESNIFDIPHHLDGLRMPGLATAGLIGIAPDGIVQSYHEGMSKNVSLIVSNMAQECGQLPGASVTKLKGAACVNFFEKAFSFVSPVTGAAAAKVYAAEIAQDCQLAFDSMAADIEMTCGSNAVALAAAEKRLASETATSAAPVYHVFNAQTSAGCMGTAGKCYANHGSDLGMACTGKGPRADALRDAWIEFATTSRVAAWVPVDATPAQATAVVMEDNGTRSVGGWKASTCEFWRQHKLGGQQFWWSD
jgi:hypothetical protein